MIRFKTTGGFSNLRSFLKRSRDSQLKRILDNYGKQGVLLLQSFTPIDSGLTASSWYYEIEKTSTGYDLIFCNSNVQSGVNIAVLIQYGHGTASGYYVAPRDYINPALQPMLKKLSDDIREEVSKL